MVQVRYLPLLLRISPRLQMFLPQRVRLLLVLLWPNHPSCQIDHLSILPDRLLHHPRLLIAQIAHVPCWAHRVLSHCLYSIQNLRFHRRAKTILLPLRMTLMIPLRPIMTPPIQHLLPLEIHLDSFEVVALLHRALAENVNWSTPSTLTILRS